MTDAGDKEHWQVAATIERRHVANGVPVYLGRREDGAYAVLKQNGSEWLLHGPVVTVETALRFAEHVAAGNPRALTSPDAMLILATAVLSFFDVTVRVPPAPPADGKPPDLAAAPSTSGAAALPPDHPSCMRCGE